jgi:hypothetical protein
MSRNPASTTSNGSSAANHKLPDPPPAPAAELVAGERVTVLDDAGGTPLPKERKRRILKPRGGYELHVEPMLRLNDDHPADLGTSVSSAEVRAAAAEASGLAPKEAAAHARWSALADRRLELLGLVWKKLLEIYGKASNSPSLKAHPTVIAFAGLLKIGPRAPKPAK